MAGEKIVERVFAAGCRPNLQPVEREPFAGADVVSVVERDGQQLFVFIDDEAERIAVEEMRVDAFGGSEKAHDLVEPDALGR